MESNMSLSIGFKGGVQVNGTFHRTQLPITVGGIISTGADNDGLTAKFGYGVSEKPAEKNEFYIGLPTGAEFRGVIGLDPSMLENQPAMPDQFVQGLPVTVVRYGPAWFMSWTKVAAGAIDPVAGCLVMVNNATGAIEFMAAGSTPPAGYTEINASVVLVDEDTNGALLFIGANNI